MHVCEFAAAGKGARFGGMMFALPELLEIGGGGRVWCVQIWTIGFTDFSKSRRAHPGFPCGAF